MSNEWKMEQFSATEIEENIKNKVFLIPKYQRGVVWNDKKRAGLVDTIKKGLPFGTLLLYKDCNSTYQIIDGLQRSNAIIQFVTNPAQFFEDEDIEPQAVEQITDIVNEKISETIHTDIIKDLLVKWVKGHETLSDVDAMQFADFGASVASEYPSCNDKIIEIGNIIKPMMKRFQAVCKKINDTKIPAIVMSGDANQLPTLFKRINSQGMQLSKYQIFAAAWIGRQYKLSKELSGLVDANRNRYDKMLEGRGTIDDYDSSSYVNAMELDTFEIAFGLGKYLSKQYPALFDKPQDDKSVESIGFTLITACLGMKNQDARNMNIKLDELIGQKYIDDFLKKIIESVKVVDECVGKFSKFKLNSSSSSSVKPLHSEFQIASIIVSVFLMKYANITMDQSDNVMSITYDFTQVCKDWKKKDEQAFKKNVGKIYIMDSLQKKWSGTGDKKLDMILVNPRHYTRDVAIDEFERVVDAWFSTLNDERKEYKKITSPKEQELLFLSAVYMDYFSASQQVDDSCYDIEHLATQHLMKAHLERFNGELRLPISSIGNLCLLPQYENRSKKEKTLYDDDGYLKKSNYSLKEIEEKYSFTASKDLEWIKDMKMSKSLLEKNYLKFINIHFNNLKTKLKDHYDRI
ncbi:MAG: DUF262 domain-containing protein [Lachnospiraceae bacterium]|nr:DUF262 domain-containing protein [Lachnospiraceae bacterium]